MHVVIPTEENMSSDSITKRVETIPLMLDTCKVFFWI